MGIAVLTPEGRDGMKLLRSGDEVHLVSAGYYDGKLG